jgi:DNA repair exonuclease SbcCD ATPase subunit
MYNSVQLKTEIETLETTNKENSTEIERLNKIITECNNKINGFQKNKDLLLVAKTQIDESLTNIDVATLESKIKQITEEGIENKQKIELKKKQIEEIGEVVFSEEDYKKYKAENDKLIDDMAVTRTEIKNIKDFNKTLMNAEICPTCHRKLDGIDNTEQIKQNDAKIDEYTKKGIEMSERSAHLQKLMSEIEEKREKKNKIHVLTLEVSAFSGANEALRSELRDKNNLLKEINKNKEAITKNNKIDVEINVTNTNIKTEEDIKQTSINNISVLEREIAKNNELISTKNSYLLKIENERKEERYWKLYLEMIGKDGISKIVLRNTLPIINSELNRLLGDVTDFKVEVVMNEKNDVDFLLIRDETVTRLSAASGLEKTQSALALRVVLGKMSRLSMPPFILLDEVLGTVASENYDNMRKLYNKITEYYEFILHITHINEIVDWHDSIVTVQKIDNISRIK